MGTVVSKHLSVYEDSDSSSFSEQAAVWCLVIFFNILPS